MCQNHQLRSCPTFGKALEIRLAHQHMLTTKQISSSFANVFESFITKLSMEDYAIGSSGLDQKGSSTV